MHSWASKSFQSDTESMWWQCRVLKVVELARFTNNKGSGVKYSLEPVSSRLGSASQNNVAVVHPQCYKGMDQCRCGFDGKRMSGTSELAQPVKTHCANIRNVLVYAQVVWLRFVAMSPVPVSRNFFNSLLTPCFVQLFSENYLSTSLVCTSLNTNFLSKSCSCRWIPCCLLTSTAMTSAVTNFWCYKLITIVNK